MKTIKSVVQVSTSRGGACPEKCGENFDPDTFTRSVNHLLSQHGYKVEHIGQETSWDSDGRPWQSTIAVLSTGG